MRLLLLIWSALLMHPVAVGARPPSWGTPVDMLEVEVGKPFGHKAVFPLRPGSSGVLGFYTFQAPNRIDSKVAFSSYQVAIWEETEVVYYVRGTSPLVSEAECKKQFDSIVQLLQATRNPRIVSTEYARFEAVHGDLQFIVGCQLGAGSPYIDLQFMVRSQSIYERVRAKAGRPGG